LSDVFGEYATLIFTIASLRAIEKTPYYDLEDAYGGSFFSVFDKTLSMSKSSLSEFLKNFCRFKAQFISFMKKDIEEDEILIFDGTNFLCGSQNISHAASGYKHGHNYKTQAGLLYAYSPGKRKLVYYKLLEGSVSDAKSLSDLLREADIKKGVAILDNGFASSDNLLGLINQKEKYIMALRRDSRYVTDEIMDDGNIGIKALEKFTNNHESVFAYETKDEDDNRICIYYNQTIAGVEKSEYIDKLNNKWKGYDEKGYEKACRRFGIYIIRTNVKEFSLKKIYEYYKSRFEIEYIFDTIKNTLEFDKAYVHNDAALETWAFINHISILITQAIYDYMTDKEVNISLHSLFKKLRQVVKQKNISDKNDIYDLQLIPAKTKKLLEKLEVIP